MSRADPLLASSHSKPSLLWETPLSYIVSSLKAMLKVEVARKVQLYWSWGSATFLTLPSLVLEFHYQEFSLEWTTLGETASCSGMDFFFRIKEVLM